MSRFAVEIAPAARRDLNGIELWLEARVSARVAIRVIEGIFRQIGRLRSDALLGAPRSAYGSSTRFVRAAPYLIYYDVVGRQVMVLRILHEAQDRDAIMGGGAD